MKKRTLLCACALIFGQVHLSDAAPLGGEATEKLLELEKIRKASEYPILLGSGEALDALVEKVLGTTIPKDARYQGRVKDVGAVYASYATLASGKSQIDIEAVKRAFEDVDLPFPIRSQAAGLLFVKTPTPDYLAAYLLGGLNRYEGLAALDRETCLAAIRINAAKAYAEQITDVDPDQRWASKSIAVHLPDIVKILDAGHDSDRQTAKLIVRDFNLFKPSADLPPNPIVQTDAAVVRKLLATSPQMAEEMGLHLLQSDDRSAIDELLRVPELADVLRQVRDRLRKETTDVLNYTSRTDAAPQK